MRNRFTHSLMVIISLLLAIFISFFSKVNVSAEQRWYVSFVSDQSFSGIWAVISTPTTSPSRVYDETNSVTTASVSGLYWVQAGWIFFPDRYGSQAWRYYEYRDPNLGQDLIRSEVQQWGTEVKYEVSYHGNQWCPWIDEVMQPACFDITSPPPMTMAAQAEIHDFPLSGLDTNFKDIKLRDLNNIWHYPTLTNHVSADPPYNYQIIASDWFWAFRDQTFEIFIGTIISPSNMGR